MPIKKVKGGYKVKYAGSPPKKTRTRIAAKRIQKKQRKA